MKKIILLIVTLSLAEGSFLFSQENNTLVSRKGESYLPDSADWAIGIDAAPVLNYLGNFFHGGNTPNTAPTWNYPGTPFAITGKIFKSKTKAYRAIVRVGVGVNTKNNYVIKDGQTGAPDSSVTVTDQLKSTYHSFVIGFGKETRRGKTRLQGYYGWMLLAGNSGRTDNYSYGNNFSNTNPTPSSTNWTNNTSGPATMRITKQTYGATWMFGTRIFVGGEYFIFPKVAVGAEFGYGFSVTSTGDGIKTTAQWDGTNNQLKLTDTRTGRSSSLGLDTDVNGMQLMPTGSLMLTMHF